MLDLLNYLATAQASTAVRDLLELPNQVAEQRAGCHRELRMLYLSKERRSWIASSNTAEGPWTTVRITKSAGRFGDEDDGKVYYRSDGNRFIVTDLGDGTKTHRYRTGTMGANSPRIIYEIREAGAGEWGHLTAALVAVESDLADAICRVMLASLRVANLEVS